MAAKTGGKTGRPPFKNREQKIVSLRKYVAQEILDTGAIPNLRMLGDALGSLVGSAGRIVEGQLPRRGVAEGRAEWQGYGTAR